MTEGQNIPHQLNADFTKAPKLGLGENKLQSEMSSQHQTQGACHELQTLERSLISISCLSCASAARAGAFPSAHTIQLNTETTAPGY